MVADRLLYLGANGVSLFLQRNAPYHLPRVAVNKKVATLFDYAEWSFGLRVDTPQAICHTWHRLCPAANRGGTGHFVNGSFCIQLASIKYIQGGEQGHAKGRY